MKAAEEYCQVKNSARTSLPHSQGVALFIGANLSINDRMILNVFKKEVHIRTVYQKRGKGTCQRRNPKCFEIKFFRIFMARNHTQRKSGKR